MHAGISEHIRNIFTQFKRPKHNTHILYHKRGNTIDLVTVFDTILMSWQMRQKLILQCLYENPMSNNSVNWLFLKLHCKGFYQQILGVITVLKFLQKLALDFPYIVCNFSQKIFTDKLCIENFYKRFSVFQRLCNALKFFPVESLRVKLQFTVHIFFKTAVLQKLFDIRFSYKHCNFSWSLPTCQEGVKSRDIRSDSIVSRNYSQPAIMGSCYYKLFYCCQIAIFCYFWCESSTKVSLLFSYSYLVM